MFHMKQIIELFLLIKKMFHMKQIIELFLLVKNVSHETNTKKYITNVDKHINKYVSHET